MEPKTNPRSTRQRPFAALVLAVYLSFAAWTFWFNDDVLRALYWFMPISILLWFVLRRLRGNR